MQPGERAFGDSKFYIINLKYDNNASFNNLRLGIHLILLRNSVTVFRETHGVDNTNLQAVMPSKNVNA
jgi:hypothetical protein